MEQKTSSADNFGKIVRNGEAVNNQSIKNTAEAFLNNQDQNQNQNLNQSIQSASGQDFRNLYPDASRAQTSNFNASSNRHSYEQERHTPQGSSLNMNQSTVSSKSDAELNEQKSGGKSLDHTIEFHSKELGPNCVASPDAFTISNSGNIMKMNLEVHHKFHLMLTEKVTSVKLILSLNRDDPSQPFLTVDCKQGSKNYLSWTSEIVIPEKFIQTCTYKYEIFHRGWVINNLKSTKTKCLGNFHCHFDLECNHIEEYIFFVDFPLWLFFRSQSSTFAACLETFFYYYNSRKSEFIQLKVLSDLTEYLSKVQISDENAFGRRFSAIVLLVYFQNLQNDITKTEETNMLSLVCHIILTNLDGINDLTHAFPNLKQTLKDGTNFIARYSSNNSSFWIKNLPKMVEMDPDCSFLSDQYSLKLRFDQSTEILLSCDSFFRNLDPPPKMRLIRYLLDSTDSLKMLLDAYLMLVRQTIVREGDECKQVEEHVSSRFQLMHNRLLPDEKIHSILMCSGLCRVDRDSYVCCMLHTYGLNVLNSLDSKTYVDKNVIESLRKIIDFCKLFEIKGNLHHTQSKALKLLSSHKLPEFRSLFLFSFSKIFEQNVSEAMLSQLSEIWINGILTSYSYSYSPYSANSRTSISKVFDAIAEAFNKVDEQIFKFIILKACQIIKINDYPFNELLSVAPELEKFNNDDAEDSFLNLLEGSLQISIHKNKYFALKAVRMVDESGLNVDSRLRDGLLLCLLCTQSSIKEGDFSAPSLLTATISAEAHPLEFWFQFSRIKFHQSSSILLDERFRAFKLSLKHLFKLFRQKCLTIKDIKGIQEKGEPFWFNTFKVISVDERDVKRELEHLTNAVAMYEQNLTCISLFLDIFCELKLRFSAGDAALCKWKEWLAWMQKSMDEVNISSIGPSYWPAEFEVFMNLATPLKILKPSAVFINIYEHVLVSNGIEKILRPSVECSTINANALVQNAVILEVNSIISLSDMEKNVGVKDEGSEIILEVAQNENTEDSFEDEAANITDLTEEELTKFELETELESETETKNEDVDLIPEENTAMGGSQSKDETLFCLTLKCFENALQLYSSLWQKYFGHESVAKTLTMDDVHLMWHHVHHEKVNVEFALALEHLEKFHSFRLMERLIWMVNEWLYFQENQNMHSILSKAIRKLGLKVMAEYGTLGSLVSAFKNDLFFDYESNLKRFSDSIFRKLPPGCSSVIDQLVEGEKLYKFLNQHVDEEMRHLIDAVEEHSEDFLREAVIKDFIDIHAFMRPLLKAEQLTIEIISQAISQSNFDGYQISVKIKCCNDNISAITQFFATIANRELNLKDHVSKILRGGVYSFEMVKGMEESADACEVKFTCNSNIETNEECSAMASTLNNSRSYSFPDIQELKSRARLLMNTNRNLKFTESSRDVNVSIESNAMIPFLNQVDAVEICALIIQQLYEVGHFSYGISWRRDLRYGELNDLLNDLNENLLNWKNEMKKARKAYPALNHFTSNDLRILEKFMYGEANGEATHECLHLLQWANPSLKENALITLTNNLKRNESNVIIRFNEIGKRVENILNVDDVSNHSEQHVNLVLENLVKLVTVEDLHYQINSVMSFYLHRRLNLENIGNHLLICHESTSWEEVKLHVFKFLRSMNSKSCIYSLIHLENLEFSVQTRLIKLLKKKFEDRKLFVGVNDAKLILVSDKSCQVLTVLSHHLNLNLMPVSGKTDEEMKKVVAKSTLPVHIITSTLPGLGKTSLIKEQALAKGLRLVNFPINGSCSSNFLITRLKDLKLSESDCLHFDIGQVTKSFEVNLLLFELIFFKRLRASKAGVYRLPHCEIFLEITNTLANQLFASIPNLKWLPLTNLEWSMDRFSPSLDLQDDMQIVCLYLDHLEKGILNTTDICLDGDNVHNSVDRRRCSYLLNKYFIQSAEHRSQMDHHHGIGHPQLMSFSLLQIFVSLMSQQLRTLSKSIFFTVETLHDIGVGRQDIRSMIVKGFIETIREVALRSVKPWIQEQQIELQNSNLNLEKAMQEADRLLEERMRGMVRWMDTNRLMLLFHADGSCVLPLYRELEYVPKTIKDLFNSQMFPSQGSSLKIYQNLSSDEIFEELWPILTTTRPEKPDYAFTPDNVLKMGFIHLRLQAGVPVLLMGETGCGKTRLIEVLAELSGVTLRYMCLNAGISREQITQFVNACNEESMVNPLKVWAFLDEINTCNHLGLLKELLCQKSMQGQALNSNLYFLAACNPYRIADIPSFSAGLSITSLQTRRKALDTRLAYRVHPLPQSLLDHVWDYGMLSPKDEESCITSMVNSELKSSDASRAACLISLLCKSQQFARESGGEASVSLRDIGRCLKLLKWFENDLRNRPLKIKKGLRRTEAEIQFIATILSFSHCYYVRLATSELREEYRKLFSNCFNKNVFIMRMKNLLNHFATGSNYECSSELFLKILQDEQMDFLSRMELPCGIAKNNSLLESVFVVLVCILNRLPIFVVGKPGSGKTLALQLLYSNLRGDQSNDAYFKKLPRMYMISYQGSKSSTSEGVMKIFEKAKRYAKDSTRESLLVVIVLDEVGLAEISSHNPLKVLHPLLESNNPDIAVVGISNWSLDSSKMNRAIHLSQPDPDATDLFQTSCAILKSHGKDLETNKWHKKLNHLCKAHLSFVKTQKYDHFYGLRDFYSLIKHLRTQPIDAVLSPEAIEMALTRNYGGITEEQSKIKQMFLNKNGNQIENPFVDKFKLIRDNVHDKEARHLLIITRGGSGANILEYILNSDEENLLVICGSQLKDDAESEDYSYSLLSSIILHMEAGRTILLKGVERIWSALYDMLNQHYTIVARRRNCRIALGPYSNPMCYVHEKFRCIITVEQSELTNLDPPFLNRFEKQVLTYESFLNESTVPILKQLKDWVRNISTIRSPSTRKLLPFKTEDIFASYDEDTLPALITRVSFGCNGENMLERCKQELICLAFSDSIIRMPFSSLAQENPSEVKSLSDYYFDSSHQNNLKDMIDELIRNHNKKDMKALVITKSSIHFNLSLLFDTPALFELERLGAFTAESQLQNRIHHFLFENESKMFLIIQMNYETDHPHLNLTKFTIDRLVSEYNHITKQRNACKMQKNVILLVHTNLQEKQESKVKNVSCNIFSGWKQYAFDSLEPHSIPLREYLNRTVAEVVKDDLYNFSENAPRIFTWALLQIEYPSYVDSPTHVHEVVQMICSDEELLNCFKTRLLTELEDIKCCRDWQSAVACDRGRMFLSRTLNKALVQYVEEKVKLVIRRLLFLLEKEMTLGSVVAACRDDAEDTEGGVDVKRNWKIALTLMISERGLLDIKSEKLDEMKGNNLQIPFYIVRKLPFSNLYSCHVDKQFRDFYLNEIRSCSMEDQDRISLRNKILDSMHFECSSVWNELSVSSFIESMRYEHRVLDYAHDLLLSKAAEQENEKGDEKENIEEKYQMAWEIVLLGNALTITHVACLLDLHIVLWEREGEMRDQFKILVECMYKFELNEFLKELKHRFNISTRGGNANEKRYASFLDEIVDKCSAQLLPTAHSQILQNWGMDDWIEKANILFSVIGSESRVWKALPAFYTLYDFMHSVVKVTGSGVNILNELAAWISANGISPPLIYLHDQLLALWRPNTNAQNESYDFDTFKKEWNAFFYRFMLRCSKHYISKDHFIKIAGFVLNGMEKVSSEHVPMAMNLLTKTHLGAGIPNTHAFRDILHSQSSMRRFLQVGFINTLENGGDLYEPVEEALLGGMEQEDWFVLLSDLIQSEFCPNVSFKLLNGEGDGVWDSYDHFQRCIETASNIVSREMEGRGEVERSNKGYLSKLRFLCALALLRATMEGISTLVAEEGRRTAFNGLINVLNSVLFGSLPNQTALLAILFKRLRKVEGMSFFDIIAKSKEYRWARNGKEMSMLLDHRRLKSSREVLVDRLGYDPFWCGTDVYNQANRALVRLIQGQDAEMKKFVQKCLNDRDHRSSLLSVFASKFYLARSNRPLHRKELRAVQKLASNSNMLGKTSSPSFFRKIKSFSLNAFPKENILNISNSTTNDLHLKSVVSHFIMALESFPPASPFSGYANLSEDYILQSFFLTGPSDLQSMVFNAVAKREPITLYKCNNCGCVYSIGNCGEPAMEARCMNCKSVIGGSNHMPVASTSKISGNQQTSFERKDLKGYVFDGFASDKTYCVRNLTPASYRILRFFCHCALLWGSTSSSTSDAQLSQLQGLPQTKASASEKLSQLISEDLQMLELMLSRSRETVCLLLHAFIHHLSRIQVNGPLLTIELRDEWESAFQQIAFPLINDAVRVAAGFKDAHAEGNGLTPLERMIDERDEDDASTSDSAVWKRLLRFKANPCFHHLRTSILDGVCQENEEGEPTFPFLRLFFKFQDNLHRIQNLNPILRWVNELGRNLKNRIMRLEAVSTTVQEYIDGAEGNKRGLEQMFDDFAKVWNQVSPFVHQFECTEFAEPIPVMDRTASLSLSLVENRDNGAFLCGILHHLIQIQNHFLSRVEELPSSQSGHCTAVFDFQQRIKTKGDIEVQKSNASQIIAYDQDVIESIVRLHSDLRYGWGETIHCDTNEIEKEIASFLLCDKRKLAFHANEKFEYVGETFDRNATILFELSQSIPQQKVNHDVIAQLLLELESSGNGVGNLLMALQLCFEFLVRTKGDSQESLQTYCERWLDSKARAELNRRCLHPLRLAHAVSLYEELEDVLIPNIPDMIHDSYKAKLPSSMKKNIIDGLKELMGAGGKQGAKDEKGKSIVDKEETHKFDLDALMKAVSRFVLRYLCRESFHPDHPMEMYLSNESLACFSTPAPDLSDILPYCVLLKHALEVFCILSDRIHLYFIFVRVIRNQEVTNVEVGFLAF